MQCLYRISDAGRAKEKLETASKMYCLDNFISEFGNKIIVIADNCQKETIEEIKRRGIDAIETSLGNSASWRFAIEYALDNFEDETAIYLIEDDYLHFPGSLNALKEGLELADYVTLYDHLDKYKNFTEGGPNPYVTKGGEETILRISKSLHWKETNSTTMSFATTVKTLREDKKLWWLCTKNTLPNDFLAFQLLTGQKLLFTRAYYKRSVLQLLSRIVFRQRRTLISAIPGLATHAELEWLSPITMFHHKKSWCDI